MLEDDNLCWKGSHPPFEIPKEQIERQKLEEKRKEKRRSIFIWSFIIFCWIMFIYEIIATIVVKNRNIIKAEDYTFEDYVFAKTRLNEDYENLSIYKYKNLSKNDVRQCAKQSVPLFWCIQLDVGFLRNKAGTCSFISGLIMIDRDLSVNDYAKAVFHERLHLYYYTACERFVQYQTFRFLYESDNVYIRKIGVEIALEIFNNQYPENYNCTSQIIKYFVERG